VGDLLPHLESVFPKSWPSSDPPADWCWDDLFRSLYLVVREYLDERGDPVDREDRHKRAWQAASTGYAELRYERDSKEIANVKGVGVRTVERWRADLRAALIRAGIRTGRELPAPRPIPSEGG
jgi:hypothetical protein